MHEHQLESYQDNDHCHPALEHGERRTRWVIALTLITMGAEIAVGRWTGSLALTTDGWHMASHAGALGLAAAAYAIARKRARDGKLAFGPGKILALAGYTNALLLLAVAAWMIGEGALRLRHPVTIDFRDALPVAVLGLAVNLVSAWILGPERAHDDHHEHHAQDRADGERSPRHEHDTNLQAAYLHIAADALTSVLAIGALVGARSFGVVWLDPIVAMVGGGLIVWWSVSLLREAGRDLLDLISDEGVEVRVREALEAIDDVRVVDLHVWALGTRRNGCVVSIVTSAPKAPTHYREIVRSTARVAHLTVEVHACDHAQAGVHGSARLHAVALPAEAQ